MDAADPRKICYCFDIYEDELRRMIVRRGLRSVADVQRLTRACLGCRTCRPDVEALLEELTTWRTAE